MASQPLDRILPPVTGKSPQHSHEAPVPGTHHADETVKERKIRDGRGKDAKWTAPHTTAQMHNEELAAKLVERLTAKLKNRLTAKLMNCLTAKLVDRLTAKLMNRLTAKLVDRLTAKLVVVKLVKVRLTNCFA